MLAPIQPTWQPTSTPTLRKQVSDGRAETKSLYCVPEFVPLFVEWVGSLGEYQ